MARHRLVALVAAIAALAALGSQAWSPARLGAQGAPATPQVTPTAPPSQAPSTGTGRDVWGVITQGGTKKLNIAIPDFAVVAGADPGGTARLLATVAGTDLNFTGQFSAVSGTAAIPAGNTVALEQAWKDFAAAGAHAALHGLLGVRPDRLEVEVRLYDLTASPPRLIVTRKFELPADQARRLAHKVADEVVLQFTGEPGVADTKVAFVAGRAGAAKEIQIVDYDGAGPRSVTRNGSINLTPAWSPDARSLAFTSYKNGYPDLFRAFPFERRPDQTLAAFIGINSSPSWSPDIKNVAMTLSKDGNPDIYVLTLTTGNFRRLTRHAGIDTDPSWSPNGREIAFVSDREGQPHVFVMDAEGANVRRVTSGGHQTQPRWSPRGDTIVFTMRQGTHDLWAINADGSNVRRLTAGPADNQGPSWAPDGRHLVFQSNRLGPWQLFVMFPDGSEQTPITRGVEERTSPSWSPRLP
ncbi:MAG: Tol-Pal system beta propeller repeat protein TolB [Candidatus Rokubacteria bacterium]|nr:Tol-Pal system beta propeller repeat protein TolB [Candidatus Rokubacteria bacterium]MBI3825999.1 Tol-Pal system beta propeller repeat protein TolB [Candidatus Rokubacteria bacterium]